MIYKGTTSQKAFKGSLKPVNIYKGSTKVAGWQNQTKTGQSISFDNTYNDVAEVTATGNSSRTTTVTGKNLFDKEMAFLTMAAEATNLGKYVPNKVSYGGRDDVVKCHSLSFFWSGGTPATEFYFSPYNFKSNTRYTIQFDLMYDEGVAARQQYLRIWYTDGTESHSPISGYADETKTWTHYVVTSIAGKTIQQFGWLYYTPSYFYLDLNSWQVEEGTVATAYEAFVPTTPTYLHPAYLEGVSGNLISRTQNLYNIADGFTTANMVTSPTILSNGIMADGKVGVSNLAWSGGAINFVGSVRSPNLIISFDYEILGQKNLENGTPLTSIGVVNCTPSFINVTVGEKGRASFTTNSSSPGTVYVMYINSHTIKITNICVGLSTYVPYAKSTVSLACQGNSTYVPVGTPASKISQLHMVNGVYDSYNVATGEFTQRIAVKIYNGTEQWYTVSTASPYVYYVVPPQGHKLGYQMSLCSHFINKNSAFTRTVANMFYFSDHPTVDRIYFNTGPMFTTAAQFAAWVAAQYAAGTPLTLWMILPEPIVSYKTLAEVKTYYPNTVIEQDGIVKADLSATAKITS